MNALIDWLRDRRARHVVTEADDLRTRAVVSMSTGHILELGDATDREAVDGLPATVSTSPRSPIEARQCVNRWCHAWFWDPSSNDRCACCRAMPGDTS